MRAFFFFKVWAHVYGRDNLNVAPEDHAVLLTEAPLNPYKNRRQCAETFFENFGVPAMFCAPQVRWADTSHSKAARLGSIFSGRLNSSKNYRLVY